MELTGSLSVFHNEVIQSFQLKNLFINTNTFINLGYIPGINSFPTPVLTSFHNLFVAAYTQKLKQHTFD